MGYLFRATKKFLVKSFRALTSLAQYNLSVPHPGVASLTVKYFLLIHLFVCLKKKAIVTSVWWVDEQLSINLEIRSEEYPRQHEPK